LTAGANLCFCVIGLAAGLRQQLEFIAEKLEKGKLKLEEKEVELEEHLRVFASAAPAEQQDLEKRVKEMKVVYLMFVAKRMFNPFHILFAICVHP
jgi:hypothetical protein